MRLWRLLRGKPGGGGARLSNVRRKRMAATLRALDGRLNGASYRDIAQRLYDRKRLDSEPWKTASLRTVTIRLVAAGLAMMRGEYRELLRLQ